MQSRGAKVAAGPGSVARTAAFTACACPRARCQNCSRCNVCTRSKWHPEALLYRRVRTVIIFLHAVSIIHSKNCIQSRYTNLKRLESSGFKFGRVLSFTLKSAGILPT